MQDFPLVQIIAYFKQSLESSGVVVFDNGSSYFMPPGLNINQHDSNESKSMELMVHRKGGVGYCYVSRYKFRNQKEFDLLYHDAIETMAISNSLTWRSRVPNETGHITYPAKVEDFKTHKDLNDLLIYIDPRNDEIKIFNESLILELITKVARGV